MTEQVGSGVSPQDALPPVRVEIRFERFPTGIKGAFVLRGADGNPHSVRVETAGLSRIPSGTIRSVGVEDRLLDAAPTNDLVIPFELGLSGLDPGWYRIEAAVRVDGGRAWPAASRPFSIPWPRGEVRRGSFPVGQRVSVGARRFVVERVELQQDCAAVVWRTDLEPGEAGGPEESDAQAEALLVADGAPLERLPAEAASRRQPFRRQGEGTSLSYPVPRDTRALAVLMRLPSGEQSRPLPLP